MRKRLASCVLAAAALALGAGPAGAHGGDTALAHSCIDDAGNVKIVAADASCKKHEMALDWARDGGAGGGTTYTAGAGLTLSPANEFSVNDVPWGELTFVPAGFADGVDNEGPDLTWGNLTGIPSDLADGDDDGSAQLRTDLSVDDGQPNESSDPVSFSKLKDLTTMSGDGRITGSFVRDDSIESQDIRNGTITASDLAGSDAAGATVVGAVTSEKIADGTIQARDLASGVISRVVETVEVDPGPVEAGQRTHVTVAAGVAVADLVTVSPPDSLETGLVFAGSAVRADGAVTIYLHNASLGTINGDRQLWTVHRIRVP